jgi:diacylglycerol kinase (ATP)
LFGGTPILHDKATNRATGRFMRRIINAFFFSIDGLARAARTEAAVRQELIALALALPLAFLVARSAFDYALLIGVLLIVLAVELLNTAIEKLCDHVRPERHDDIKFIKDLGSAAVLCVLTLAVMVWCVQLYYRLVHW